MTDLKEIQVLFYLFVHYFNVGKEKHFEFLDSKGKAFDIKKEWCQRALWSMYLDKLVYDFDPHVAYVGNNIKYAHNDTHTFVLCPRGIYYLFEGCNNAIAYVSPKSVDELIMYPPLIVIHKILEYEKTDDKVIFKFKKLDWPDYIIKEDLKDIKKE